MHAFFQPATAHEHLPESDNARSARDWLEQSDRAHPLGLQNRQIKLLHRSRMPPVDRLRVIEALRDAVPSVQASRVAGSRQPQPAGIRAAFDADQTMRDTPASAHLRCLAAALDGGGTVGDQVALIAHRAPGAFAPMQFDALRASRLPAPGHRRGARACCEATEKPGAGERRIKNDTLNDERPISVRAACVLYAPMVTSNPFGLKHRQLGMLFRRLVKWVGMPAGAPQPVDVTRSPDGSSNHEDMALLMPAVERICQLECMAQPSRWYCESRNITLSGHQGKRHVQWVESSGRAVDLELACIEPVT